ncbi:hypothetical protein [Paraburkholderia adhaesiva]|uniref:hypothetical protein n=1 Tax=Paraburkholderia adhaesiva TaxID=2883244 RepID=UPI001F2052D3|nr:hypothetical protein [Paraburkholderia adhaesiva]
MPAIDLYHRFASPREIASTVHADFDAFFRIALDLPCDRPELWIRLTSDIGTTTREGRELPPCIGFVLLRRVLTLKSGVSTYVACELRPADAPPPSQPVCLQLSALLEPEAYEQLLQGRTVLPAS